MDYIVAGGTEAVLNVVENAVIQKLINSEDVVIGLTACGDILFTCKVMKKERKILTISISNNPNGKILKFVRYQLYLKQKKKLLLDQQD